MEQDITQSELNEMATNMKEVADGYDDAMAAMRCADACCASSRTGGVMPKYKVECQISATIEAESEEVATDMLETEVSLGMADVDVLAINSITEEQP